MNNSTQFHIELDGLNLSDDQVKAIAADLDRVVSTHLSKLDLRDDSVTVARPNFLNPGWRGIVIRNAKLGLFATANSSGELPGVLKGLPQDPVPIHR